MSYAYKRTLTVDHTQCGSSNSTDFAVLVFISHTSMKTVANSGHINNTVTQAGGNPVTMPADLIFTSDSLGATKIPWEIDSYDGTNGILWAWVKVATLSSSVDTVFYCFYGDASITTQQNTSSVSVANTWNSSFVLVAHLSDGTTLNAKDSTSNANDGTLVNTPTATTGQIDGAALLNGSNQSINFAHGTSLGITGDITMSTWIKWNGAPSTLYPFILGKNSGNVISNYAIGTISNTREFYFDHYNVGFDTQSSGLFIQNGAWSYVSVSITGNAVSFKVDTSTASTTKSKTLISDTVDLLAALNAGSTAQLNASLDELRISNVARSADWVLSEYNNQKASSTFLSVGAEVAVGKLFTNSLLDGLGGGGSLNFNRLD